MGGLRLGLRLGLRSQLLPPRYPEPGGGARGRDDMLPPPSGAVPKLLSHGVLWAALPSHWKRWLHKCVSHNTVQA